MRVRRVMASLAATVMVTGGVVVMGAPAASAASLGDINISCGGSGVLSDSLEATTGDTFTLSNSSGDSLDVCIVSGDFPPLRFEKIGGVPTIAYVGRGYDRSVGVVLPDEVGTWVLSGRNLLPQPPLSGAMDPGPNGFDITITVRSPDCPVLSGSKPYTVTPAPTPGVDWGNCDLAGADLRGAVLRDVDLHLADLSGADLTGVTISGSYESDPTRQGTKPRDNLSGANLSGADLTGARVSVSNLTGANLSGADLTGARVRETWIEEANLTGVTWLNSQFAASRFDGSDLSGTDLQNANFIAVDGFNYVDGGGSSVAADLSFTDLRDVRFSTGDLGSEPTDNAVLIGADLTGANMANLNLINVGLDGAGLTDVNLSGATLAGASLRRAGGFDVDLSGVVMTRADLREVYLPGANMYAVLFDRGDLSIAYLPGANLTDANLVGTNLTDSNLSGANLTRANLTGANLTRTNFSGATGTGLRSFSTLAAASPGANLTDANLTDANLTDANLTGADLTGAELSGADLTGADLTGADLTDVSGSFVGTPISLPADFRVVNGYLVGPNADLSGADLTGADLTGADLTGADLTNANLSGAKLTGASGCQIRGLPINLPLGYSIENGCLTYTLVVSEFAAPVDGNMVNKAKAGQTVPFKFTVTDVNGTPITDLATVTTTITAYACESGVAVDAIEEYATGGSGLQNFGDGTYQYNWKTPKTWRGCRTLGLDLGDGVNHTADFQFK